MAEPPDPNIPKGEANSPEPAGPSRGSGAVAEVDLAAVLGAQDDGSGDDEDAHGHHEAESKLDLGDLDHVMSRSTRSDPIDDLGDSDIDSQTRGAARAPWAAAIVLLGGLWLLSSLWGDVRYFLRGSVPEDIGEVTEILDRDGVVRIDLDNRFVVVRGTPDVQHAARMETRAGATGWVRVREAGGALFAAFPGEESRRMDEFSGTYQGRLRRLRLTRSDRWIREFFNAERITEIVDVDLESVKAALSGSSSLLDAPLLDDQGNKIGLRQGDTLRLVSRPKLTRLQLGIETWKSVADAEAAVASLGVPALRISADPQVSNSPDSQRLSVLNKQTFHEFVIAASVEEAETLAASLSTAAGVSPASMDPKVGAAVVPHIASWQSDAGSVSGGKVTLEFTYGDNTTAKGWDVVSGALVERKLAGGKLSVPLAELSAVRLERQIVVHPEASVVLVDDVPSSYRMQAVLFAVVLLVMVANALALAFAVRRRLLARR